MEAVVTPLKRGSATEPVRILYLDDMENIPVSIFLSSHGVHAKVTVPSGLGNMGMGYRVSDEAKELAATTRDNVFDYVIIQNNLRTGLILARLIDLGMRKDRTLIVWTTPNPSEELMYQDLGYTHFTYVLPGDALPSALELFFRPHLKPKD